MKRFTKKWNQHFINNVVNIKDFTLSLEIGCFEGLTSLYIVENLMKPNDLLVCVDPLTDQYLNENLSEKDVMSNSTEYEFFQGQYERFLQNVNEYIESGKIKLYKDLSTNVYDNLMTDFGRNFTFIYIDGDHRPDSVYVDAINCFDLCKKDGYILFDDYLWKDTGLGIDKFLNEFNSSIKVVFKGEQVMIKKL